MMIGRVPPERLWEGAHAVQIEIIAGEIERARLAPRAHHGIEPLLRKRVARCVFALVDAEHLELALVPADHQVEPEAPLADMVGGDEFLGGDQRIEQRRMHGAEHGDALRRGQQPGRPGHGFERGAVEIGGAAITLPARDWQHEVDAARLRHAGEREAVGPARRPALRHLRRRTAGGAIGAEQAELERIAIEHREALGQRCGAGGQGLLHSPVIARPALQAEAISFRVRTHSWDEIASSLRSSQ